MDRQTLCDYKGMLSLRVASQQPVPWTEQTNWSAA